MTAEKIQFSVDTNRILEVITDQIYQSPLALLRENTQNAFDAILMRLAKNQVGYAPRIDIDLKADRIVVSDNGIGMPQSVVENNFWRAGSSGKNNDEARAAGVVGTFGIGALANFGIAERLSVETESIDTGRRTRSFTNRADLEINTDCIQIEELASRGEAGTTICVDIDAAHRLDVEQAKSYIEQFVSIVDVPVFVNGQNISQKSIEQLVPKPPQTWVYNEQSVVVDHLLKADIELSFSQNADVWVSLHNVYWNEQHIRGAVYLKSGIGRLQTFRSGFGLAAAPTSSYFSFGGVVDLLNLSPTAGREALTTDGLQFLQALVASIEKFICVKLADRPESDSSTPFMNWINANQRFSLCHNLQIRLSSAEKLRLKEIADRSQSKTYNAYDGNDESTIQAFSDPENPLLIFAQQNPRKNCEIQYLSKNAKIEMIPNSPRILSITKSGDLPMAQSALKFRLELILDEDYFLRSKIQFGTISHGLPMFVEHKSDETTITLNASAPAIQMVLGVYEGQYSAFGSVVKDFIRTHLFQKISSFVPSSTRHGADAFMKAIHRKREAFEIGDDEADLISSIWDEYSSGKIGMSQAMERAATAPRRSVQTVDQGVAAKLAEQLPDVIQNETQLNVGNPDAALSAIVGVAGPAIQRLESSTSAKLLTVDQTDPAFRGYRAFLSLTDKARSEFGDFFHQPHKTSCVWGGQRVLFIFMHHSDRYGFYYDIQARSPVQAEPGGAGFATATLILKNRIFIPIPEPIASSFRPDTGEKKLFDIRFDILRSDVEAG